MSTVKVESDNREYIKKQDGMFCTVTVMIMLYLMLVAAVWHIYIVQCLYIQLLLF